jgi:hypothetical protein
VREDRRGERLRAAARRLLRSLFPPVLQLPEPAERRLAVLFPTLDLRRVTFHRGLPWFTQRGVGGITLPGLLSPVGCRIYIRPRFWEPDTDDGFSLLAHEAFHALQMQEAGPGLGLVRPFIILYLACAAGSGFLYRGHPMETDAYVVAGLRSSLFERAVAAGIDPEPVTSSGLRFWRKLAASTPGGALVSPLWLLAWTGITAVLWLARLGVEGAGAGMVAGMWGGGTGLMCLERILRIFRRSAARRSSMDQ